MRTCRRRWGAAAASLPPLPDSAGEPAATLSRAKEEAEAGRIAEALQKNNIPTVVSEISQVAKAPIDADAETAKKVVRLMEALDDHDDVQNVYSDLNMSEELMAEVAKE